MKSMKRIILLMMMTFALFGLGLVACAQPKTDCDRLGHEWDTENMVVTQEPSCYTKGTGVVHCKRCDATDSIILDEKHNLRPDFNRTKLATCNKPGLDVKICRDCSNTFETETSALGHDFTGTSIITKEATCETEGEREVKCKRANCDGDDDGNIPAVSKNTISKLGHDWQNVKVLDKEPTFDSEGSRSFHCNRCEKTKEEETVPKLVAGKEIEYKFRIARGNLETLALGLDTITITIKDESGNVVATSNRNNFANGIMKVNLQPKQYTATVDGLPDGYKAQPSYNINPGSIDKDLIVNAELLSESEITDDVKYGLGSVIHNYTFNDVNGKTVTLEELLSTKKIVLLNFFFVYCGACQSEMPGLISAYNIYKEDMAIVMLDVYSSDTVDLIKDSFLKPFGVPESIYVVQDMTPVNEDKSKYNNICEKFGFATAPQNVIIDKEGVVVYAEGGSTSDMAFRAMFKKYTSAPYYFDDEPAPNTNRAFSLEAIAPEDRKR